MRSNNKDSDDAIAILVEYLARPVPAGERARLVTEHSGAKGKIELNEMLRSLGLDDHETLTGQSRHAYASIKSINTVRAMHPGAVPVETQDSAGVRTYAGMLVDPGL